MSAFLAIVNLDGEPVDPDRLEDLTQFLSYRGPDRLHTWVEGSVGLGHALFRTTREAAYEQQPCSLNGTTWVAGDIRVDGREELVERLGVSAEVTLEETPDSELLLRAYGALGEAALEHLLGDFSFALWDGRCRKLVCARDHFGMRALYYARPGRTIVVSNSLHCLRRYPGVSDRLNDMGVGDFLLTGSHTWIDKSITMYADIHSVPPAHALVLRDGRVHVRRYWDFPRDIPLRRYRSEMDYVERFRHVFRRAVSDRLRTDRVVVSMSGGLDSTAIAATVREIERGDDTPVDLQAVTLVFDRLPLARERLLAGLVAAKLGVPIHYVVGDDYPLLDPPVASTYPVEVYAPAIWVRLRQVISSLARVELTGEAGDNLLAFTPVLQSSMPSDPLQFVLQLLRLRLRYGRLPRFGTGLGRRGTWGLARHKSAPLPYPRWLDPDFERELGLRDRWTEWMSRVPPRRQPHHTRVEQALVEPSWNAEDQLKPLGHHPPERRDPFLDVRLIELVLSLPPVPYLFHKHILRKAMAGSLPGAILKREKTALGMYHDALLREPGAARADEWQASPELDRFVVRTKIPPIAHGALDASESYVHLRPCLLSAWLRNRW